MSLNNRIELEFPISGPTFRQGMAVVAQLQEEEHRVVPFVRAHGELVEPFSPWADGADAIVYQVEFLARPASTEVLREAMIRQLRRQGVTVRAA